MMIKFVNRITNTEMWVADERKDEYLAAGHVLAAEISAKPTETVEAKEEQPKKAATKKKTNTKK